MEFLGRPSDYHLPKNSALWYQFDDTHPVMSYNSSAAIMTVFYSADPFT
jgi:hypothetical protein